MGILAPARSIEGYRHGTIERYSARAKNAPSSGDIAALVTGRSALEPGPTDRLRLSHFARSPCCPRSPSICSLPETLEGRGKEITEHQIGVLVFDRRPGYSTIEDNIVRNYARQLRKRLAEFFAAEGSSETLRIDIPLGGYVPVFVPASEHHPAEEMRRLPVSVSIHARPAEVLSTGTTAYPRPRVGRRLMATAAIAAYSAALVSITLLISARVNTPRPRPLDRPMRFGHRCSTVRRTPTSSRRTQASIFSKISRDGHCSLPTT